MSADKLRKEFQQINNEIQRFDELGKQRQIQINALQEYLIDLNRTRITLTGLKDEKNPDETLVQLGSGVMLKAKPLETKKVLYNVGYGVMVSKSITEAIKKIDEKIKEVDKERTGLVDQLNKIIESIGNLERRAQTIYNQLQGPSKAQYDV